MGENEPLRPLALGRTRATTVDMERCAEWVGGCVRLPRPVLEDGADPFFPEAFVWLDPDGFVLGTTLFRPDEMPAGIVDLFRATTQQPAVGTPHVPARVRVASDAIAASLRAALAPDVEVVCAPTPELADIAASMRAPFAPVAPTPPAELYTAAARLFRAQPWNVLDEDAVFSITVPSLDLEHGVVSVLGGHEGERLGLLLFTSVDDFARYLEGALEILESGEDRLPSKAGRHLVLDFSRGKDVPADVRKAIGANGYEVAAPNAYPCFAALDERFNARMPDAREAKLLVLTARAFAELATSSELATLRVDGLRRSFHTPASAGGAGEVVLEYPHPELELDVDAGDDLAGDIDTLALYEDFVGSPEGRTVTAAAGDEDDPTWPLVLLNFAEEHHDATVADLTPAIVEDVVFNVLPRQPACDVRDASMIVKDLRAFFAFLARTGECPSAADCARVLEGDAERKLVAAFSRVN